MTRVFRVVGVCLLQPLFCCSCTYYTNYTSSYTSTSFYSYSYSSSSYFCCCLCFKLCSNFVPVTFLLIVLVFFFCWLKLKWCFCCSCCCCCFLLLLLLLLFLVSFFLFLFLLLLFLFSAHFSNLSLFIDFDAVALFFFYFFFLSALLAAFFLFRLSWTEAVCSFSSFHCAAFIVHVAWNSWHLDIKSICEFWKNKKQKTRIKEMRIENEEQGVSKRFAYFLLCMLRIRTVYPTHTHMTFCWFCNKYNHTERKKEKEWESERDAHIRRNICTCICWLHLSPS